MNERGGVLVESALILPLLIILIFFIIEISLILLQYIAINEGLSLASRDLSLPRNNSEQEVSICHEIVNIRLNEQMRKFKQRVIDGQFVTVVRRPSNGELMIITDADIYCFACGVFFSDQMFSKRFQKSVVLQDEEPLCEVDS